MHTRVDTNDEKIVENVLRRNEYRLPEAFHPEDVVVDIGAHIGSFARACLARGVRQVHCYEPHPENHQHLLRNCSQWAYKRAKIHARAVVPGGGDRVMLRTDAKNTGGHSVVYGEGEGIEVPTVDFGTVLDRARAAAPNKRIRLLKLDCEGAEYDLLYSLTTEELLSIDEITGEIHDFGEQYGRTEPGAGFRERTRQTLIEWLNEAGFVVETWNEMSDGLILFRAYREGVAKTERGPEPVTITEEPTEGADADRLDTDTQPSGVPGTDDTAPAKRTGKRASGGVRSRSKRGPADEPDSTDL